VSFMHLKETEWAGPDGGDGGNGGHVIFKGQPGLKSLNTIRSVYKAESGENGRAYHMQGKSGKHETIRVPMGTLFKDAQDELIFEISEERPVFIAARGGRGGKGNYYYLTNDNKAPRQFEKGHAGEEKCFFIELKLVADAALIGYPNVGKSSLLNALTRARAKVGDYSFTTLHPHVGVIEYEDFLQISLADLPGLLPDLARGLGTRYLRHLEKCKILLFVVDMSSEESSPHEQFEDMVKCIDFYEGSYLKSKKSILIAHKVDKLPSGGQELNEKLNELRRHVHHDMPIVPMSADKRINLKKFMKLLRDVYLSS
jgi:GTP-binding protein